MTCQVTAVLVRRGGSFLTLIGMLMLAGCKSRPEEYPVKGKVTLNGDPLPGAIVTFFPVGETKGQGGSALTDKEGNYQVSAPHGEGLAPGKFQVTISRSLNPDGSPADPKLTPIESPARETLPAKYSSRDATKLEAEVSRERTAIDFALELKKK